MAVIEVSVDIQAPRDRVLDLFTNLEQHPDILSGVEKIERLTDGPFAEGTRWRETRVMMGREATEVMWVTQFDPPRGYVIEAASSGVRYVSTFTFEEHDGSTKALLRFEALPQSMAAKLLSPLSFLMTGAVRKALATDFEDLKRAAEAEGTA